MKLSTLSKSLLVLCLAGSFVGCGFFQNHRIDVQQGNILDQKLASKIHVGMTRNEVLYALGSPVKETTFSNQRWEYVYSKKTGYSKAHIDRLVIYFTDDHVSSIDNQVNTVSSVLDNR